MRCKNCGADNDDNRYICEVCGSPLYDEDDFDNAANDDNDKTQTELAEYLHIKQTTYSKYELGKINIPIEVFIQLADYYDVSVDYLLGRTKKR